MPLFKRIENKKLADFCEYEPLLSYKSKESVLYMLYTPMCVTYMSKSVLFRLCIIHLFINDSATNDSVMKVQTWKATITNWFICCNIIKCFVT